MPLKRKQTLTKLNDNRKKKFKIKAIKDDLKAVSDPKARKLLRIIIKELTSIKG